MEINLLSGVIHVLSDLARLAYDRMSTRIIGFWAYFITHPELVEKAARIRKLD